jgi:hypothetical protein
MVVLSAVLLIALAAAVVYGLARNSPTMWLLPNIAIITFLVVYIFPLFTAEVGNQLVISIVICFLSMIITALAVRRVKVKFGKSPPQIGHRKLLPALGVFFCIIGIGSVFLSLYYAGGLFAVLLEGGGRSYLEVRVHSSESGILGILAWASPIGLALLLALWLESKQRYVILALFICFFLASMTGFVLLTVRHNAVATILILLATFIRYRGFSFRIAVFSALLLLMIFVGFQALRVSVLDEFSVDSAVDSFTRSVEHLDVTQHMIKQADYDGHSGFLHVLDVPIFLVPRDIWPDKPMTSTLNRIYFPSEASVGSEKAPGIVGEGYASAGYLGVVMVAVIFMAVLSMVQQRLDRYQSPFLATLFAAAFIPYAYIGIRTGVFGKHLIASIMIYCQYLLIASLSRKRLVVR